MERLPTEITIDIAAYLDLTGGKLALLSLATPTLSRAAALHATDPQVLRQPLTSQCESQNILYFEKVNPFCDYRIMAIVPTPENEHVMRLELFL